MGLHGEQGHITRFKCKKCAARLARGSIISAVAKCEMNITGLLNS